MIVRSIAKTPTETIASFDYFNDYADTRDWATRSCPPETIALLDEGYRAWLAEINQRHSSKPAAVATSANDFDLFGDDEPAQTVPAAASATFSTQEPVASIVTAAGSAIPTITPTVVESPVTLALDTQFARTVKDAKLEPDSEKLVLTTFSPFVLQVQEWAAKVDKLVPVGREPSKSEHKVISDSRKVLTKLRTGAEKERKRLKADALAFGKVIDSANNRLLELVSPIEEKLRAAEEYAEREEEKRKAALLAARTAELTALNVVPTLYNLAEMPEDVYGPLLVKMRQDYENAKVAALKAEQDRIAKEAADKAEQDRIRAENARLKADADRLAKEKADADAKAAAAKAQADAEAARVKAEADAEAARIKADADRKLAEERAAAQAREKTAKEDADFAVISAQIAGLTPTASHELATALNATMTGYLFTAPERHKSVARGSYASAQTAWKKRQDELAANAKAERDRLAAEKAKSDAKIAADKAAADAALAAAKKAADDAAAEAKRLQEAEDARLAQIEEEKARAAAAPEREKVIVYAAAIRALPIPTLSTTKGAALEQTIRAQAEKFATWLDGAAGKL